MNEIPHNIINNKHGITNNANFRITPLVYKEISKMYINDIFASSLIFSSMFLVI